MSRNLRVAMGVVIAIFGIANWFLLGFEVVTTIDDPVEEVDYGRDLRSFAAAGDIAADRDGAALYDREAAEYTETDAANFFYPPWFAVVMMTVSWIPFRILFALWSLASVGAIAWALRHMRMKRWVLATIVLLFVSPTFGGIWFGQTSAILLAILAFAVVAAAQDRNVPAGVGFALLAFKPHLFMGFGVVWLMNLRRSRQLLIVAVAVTAFLGAVSAIWMPASWGAFFENLLNTEPLALAQHEVSLFAGTQLLVAMREPLGAILAVAISLAVLGVLAAVVRRLQGDLPSAMAYAVVASLLVAPHSLHYDWLLIVVPLILLVRAQRITRTEALVVGFILAVTIPIGFSATDVQVELSDFAIHLPPWVLLGVFGWLVRRGTTERRALPASDASPVAQDDDLALRSRQEASRDNIAR